MLFLVNFYRESTWEDIDEDEFGDEWGGAKGEEIISVIQNPDSPQAIKHRVLRGPSTLFRPKTINLNYLSYNRVLAKR